MKTVFLILVTFISMQTFSQNKLDLLQNGKIWVIDTKRDLKFTKEFVNGLIHYHLGTESFEPNKFYLSETKDSVFNEEKIGTLNGKYIIEKTGNGEKTCSVYIILTLTKDTLVIRNVKFTLPKNNVTYRVIKD